MPPKKASAKSAQKSVPAKAKGEAAAGGAGDTSGPTIGATTARTTTARAITAQAVTEKCSVCSHNIVDGKDQALFCEGGKCRRWMHRYCAGVPITHFESLSASDAPFLCFCCNEGKCQREVAMLKNAVELLKLEISTLKDSLQVLQRI